MKFRPIGDFQLLTTLPSGSLATKACQHHRTEIKRRKFPQGRLPPSFKFREEKGLLWVELHKQKHSHEIFYIVSWSCFGVAFYILSYRLLKIRVIFYLKNYMNCFGEDAQKPSFLSTK